jgi:hypothetical protein
MGRFLPEDVLHGIEGYMRDLRSAHYSQDNRNKRLIELIKLANNENYKDHLCAPELGLLTFLKDEIDWSSNFTEINLVIQIFCCLSWTTVGRMAICEPELGLIPICLRLVRHRAVRTELIMMLSNCILCEKTHNSLLSAEINILSIAKDLLRENTEDHRYYEFFANFVKVSSEDNITLLIAMGVPQIILSKFLSLSERLEPETNVTVLYISYFIVGLSTSSTGAQAIRDFHQPAFFYDLSNLSHFRGIVAFFIFVNVYGETSISGDLIDESAIGTVVSFLKVIVHFDEDDVFYKRIHNKPFCFGDLELSTVICTLKTLSMTDYYRRMMIEQFPDIKFLICKALHDFNENKPQYLQKGQWGEVYAGGGGEDFRSMEYICEFLLQLALCDCGLRAGPFYKSLWTSRVFVSLGIVRSLREVLQEVSSLPKERNIPTEINRLVGLLLDRLRF